MSTSATILDQSATSASLPVKKENVTFAVVVKTDEHGKITETRATSREKDIANLKRADYGKLPDPNNPGSFITNPKETEQIAFEQTVIRPLAGTVAGFAEIVPDVDVQLEIINTGIRAKWNSKVLTALTELDAEGNLAFQPVEPNYDATALVSAASERAPKMTEGEKALKAISNIQNPELLSQLQGMIASLLAAQAAGTQQS